MPRPCRTPSWEAASTTAAPSPVSGSTISGNSAGLPWVFGPKAGFTAGAGGGIYNAGTLAVQNSTIAANTAGGLGQGGGIMNGPMRAPSVPYGSYFVPSLTISNSTITANAAHTGGGLYLSTVAPTQLAAPVSATATTLSVQTANFFTKGETIQVDGEQMTVTGVDTLHNILTVVRGVNHPSAAAHAAGARGTILAASLDAFTVANLVNNSASAYANIAGPYVCTP
jgi:hypothetical protein